MKKFSGLLVLFLMVLSISSFPQIRDTVDVPSADANGPVDALTRFLLGDTTAAGERNNINRVYKLKRGDIYLLSGRIYIDTFPLTLIADDDETKQPPVIAPFPLADGSIPRITIQVTKDAFFKNIYFQGNAPNDMRNSSDRPLAIGAAEKVKLVVDHCIVEGFKSAGVSSSGFDCSVFIKDCIWRNNNWSGVFSGQFFYNYGDAMDTVSIVNSTFFCGSSYFLCNSKQFAKYIRFEHNTLYINHTNPFYVPYISNADIKNNIFYCPASMGETDQERRDGYYDWDGERLSVFSIDTIPTDMASTYGITDANRRINFSNNAYYWPQRVKDLWAADTAVFEPVWMNQRTMDLFANDTQYPLLTAENNIEADPQFNSNLDVLVDSVEFFYQLFRTTGSGSSYFFNPQGGGIFPARWPLPENLAYSNPALLTAADGGFPLGDLNWFPDKKKDWETPTDVSKDEYQIPSEFGLEQNYPNPFNPSTLIQFYVAEKGLVTLKVYDVLGKEVATLVNEELETGSYKSTFNGNGVTSGIYFYRLDAGKFSSVRKMLLVK